MKKLSFLLATLLIGGLMLTGCKKPTDTPSEPTSKTFKVSYALGNKTKAALDIEIVTSDCFKFDVTYTGANGEQVEVKGVTLPWTSPELTVTLPFTAKIEGQATFNEADLPDPVVFGQLYYLYANGDECQFGGELMAVERNAFMPYLAENPDILKFSYSKTINR